MQTEVRSSIIKTIDYDETHEILCIEFTKGYTKKFKGVPKQIHDHILQAVSRGNFYLKHTSSNYDRV